ncbi:MAG: hypothetical protein SVU32_04345 [Candidatus Nanohaloarchaea archaeon]|nr:hypothetical protein [Candidatus Nanohaloarchaea archaeon]
MPLDPDNVSDEVLERTVENLESLGEEEQEALLESEKISSRVEQQQELKERRDQLQGEIMNTLADDEGWLFNPEAKEMEMDALLNTGDYVDQTRFDEDAEHVEAETEQGRTFPLEEPGRVDTGSSYLTDEQDEFIEELKERGAPLSAAEIGSRIGASTGKVKEAVQDAIDQYKEQGKVFEAIQAAEAGRRIAERLRDEDDEFRLDSGYTTHDVAEDLAQDAEGEYVDPGIDPAEDAKMAEQIKKRVGEALVEDAGGATTSSYLERTIKRARDSGNYREAIALSSKYVQGVELEFADQGEEAGWGEAEAEYSPDRLAREAADSYWQTIQQSSSERAKEKAYRNLAEINSMLDDEVIQDLDEDTQSKLLIASEYVDNKLSEEETYQADEQDTVEPEQGEESGYQDDDLATDNAGSQEDAVSGGTGGYEESPAEEDDSGGFFSKLLGR